MKVFPLLLAVSIVLIAGSTSIGQIGNASKISEPTRVPKVIAQDGWRVPDIRHMKFVRESSFEIDGNTVTSRRYKSSKLTYSLPVYFLNNDGSVMFYAKELNLREVVIYRTRGVVFAYSLGLIPFVRSKNGSITYAGAYLHSLIFDRDGDGIFETLFQDDMEPPEFRRRVIDLATSK